MKQLESTLQDLKCMLIEDGYKDDNIVMRTLVKAQQQVKNLNTSIVNKSFDLHELKRKVDEVFDKETSETITEWLNQQRHGKRN